MTPSLTRENLMAAYRTSLGAGEQPSYVIVGSALDEINVRQAIEDLHLDLRTAYDPHLGAGGWTLV